ncbi:enolase [Pandoraea apista]|uniref:Enolase n=1 Tax=Pandoraea pneumonica TaxID=2508299 RepID=A0A5E4RL41_9BURK|nr:MULTISPECIES: phosphopyruvate hydratase [Pandoraea]AJF01257.1 enolase [Pandoraea apista]AKH75510.1 enolase [Pandoraea apista]AKI62902.1 enolase [Pandoraea apista]VVD62568.1 enolase [Pandoraea pneumonica]
MQSIPLVEALQAREILDSRGNPTLEVTVTVTGGVTATASCPSGASTGTFEAKELRDEDTSRYRGKGVRHAMANVNGRLAASLHGKRVDRQREIDNLLIFLDGTPTKSHIGANAALATSLACARAAAEFHRIPLYAYLGGSNAHVLPVPMFNVVNGGAHATGGTDIQEYKIVPVGAPTYAEALRYGSEIYHELGKVIVSRGYTANIGDEGGYVPGAPTNELVLTFLMEAIERAGYAAGTDVVIGLDPAASAFREGDEYFLRLETMRLTSDELISFWADWLDRYPIVSLEDPLADDDWNGFANITQRLGGRVQIVGDDLFVTNPTYLRRGIDEKCCNCALIKPNQIGTVSETLDAARMALHAGYRCMVSHRSGETLDTAIADLAVALNCGQIKSGAPVRGERVAKYNRLLEIEDELGDAATYAGPNAFAVTSSVDVS